MNHRYMSNMPGRQRQTGVTLIVGLIVLVLITVLVVMGFKLSNTGLRATANQQARDEAVAAGNMVIEALITSASTDLKPNGTLADRKVLFNPDGSFVIDNTIATSAASFTATPVVTCVGAVVAGNPQASDVELDATLRGSSTWMVEKDLQISVAGKGPAEGTSVVIHQGIRMQMSEADKQVACPGT